jgi:hypothetical protein
VLEPLHLNTTILATYGSQQQTLQWKSMVN